MSIFDSEPLQVNIFQNIISSITTPNPIMIELGCAEAEYSKVFNDYFNNKCISICIDILPRQLIKAKQNCPNSILVHGYAGEKIHAQEIKEDDFNAPKIDINELIEKYSHIDILHMDIQGAEPYVMKELSKNLHKISYLFISLHKTYDDVKKYIPDYFTYIYEHPEIGGQGDGLIVIKKV